MKRSDDYQNEEFNEESDDYVYIDEDDNAKSAGGSGVVVVLGVIAAVCAVALAAAFRADLCQIYTDVDGVYTTDPRIVPNARKLDEITYDEMLELASQGAGVLHNRSVELAKKFRVDLEVLSSLERKPGTKVKEVTKVEKTTIAGVAKDTSIARIALIGLRHNPGVAFQVFDLLSKHNINVDLILQSIGREDSKDISFTVHEKDLEDAQKAFIQAVESGETMTMAEADEHFHDVIYMGTGNTRLVQILNNLREQMYRYRLEYIKDAEKRQILLVEHESILRAIRSRHVAEAKEAVRAHIDNQEITVSKNIKERE